MFVRADWRQLAIVSYEVDPALLLPRVPAGTTLDSHEGKTLVSLVAFLFERVRVLGLPLVPAFEEVNLRFYVRREDDRGLIRGVSFIRELVPRPLVALVARTFYNEPYLACRLAHHPPSAYSWTVGGDAGSVSLSGVGGFEPLSAGSREEFVAEHYYGYGRARSGRTLEYHVTHPPWRVARAASARLTGEAALFGREFAGLFEGEPASIFLADGSEVGVSWPRVLPVYTRSRG